MCQVINLTPHPVLVADEEGTIVANFPPSGSVARCSISQEVVGSVGGVPLKRSVFGEVQALPEPTEGVIFIASTLVAQRACRADVVSPDTGPTAIRKDGQVVAVRAFQAFA